MAAVPTYKIRNRRTGQFRVVNQSDYHSEFRTGDGRFKSVLCGGDWEIVSENHAGGDAGYQESKKNLETLVNIEMKRERDRLGEKR